MTDRWNDTTAAMPAEATAGSGHAVVIGGSMAGLLAARVLASHFELVTIVERDRLPAEPVPRKGVPQAHHVHALLPRGRLILEDLFPGFTEDMQAAGALLADVGRDLAWLTPAGWGVNFDAGIPFVMGSRGLIEWVVRHRVAALPRVAFLQGRDVTGLLQDAHGTGVAGLRMRRRGADGQEAADEVIHADLVVDTSGRSSRAPEWLEAIGYSRPEETVVDGRIGYASRIFEPSRNRRFDFKGLFVQAAPPDVLRSGLVFSIEGGRWLVTLIGLGGDHPPTDEQGYLEFARSLRTSRLYEAIKDATPCSPILGFRKAENRLRHYERMRRAPENFLVVGDAACAFNPVYGQGMTAAAIGVMTLARCLREQLRRQPGFDMTGLARRFQKELARVNADVWMMATGQDFRVRETIGGPAPRSARLMHRYMDQVIRLSTQDPAVCKRLLDVFGLLEPPSSLFRPWMVTRVVKGVLAPKPVPARARATGELRQANLV
jgi:2-polyprenyl-6-methoxyphenol hydroxylase-like FAD-dependent oxidoreductase